MKTARTGEGRSPVAWLDGANKVFMALCIASLMLMMLVVAANVVGRLFFRSPLLGTVEYVGFLGAVLISAALVPSQMARRNINIPIITDTLPDEGRRVFEIAAQLLSLFIVAALAVTGGAYGWEMLVRGEKTSVLAWPVAPFRLLWALSCALLFVVIALQLLVTAGRKR